MSQARSSCSDRLHSFCLGDGPREGSSGASSLNYCANRKTGPGNAHNQWKKLQTALSKRDPILPRSFEEMGLLMFVFIAGVYFR